MLNKNNKHIEQKSSVKALAPKMGVTTDHGNMQDLQGDFSENRVSTTIEHLFKFSQDLQ